MTWLWSITFILIYGALAYHRASLWVFAISYAVLSALMVKQLGLTAGVLMTLLVILAIFTPLVLAPLRRRYLTQHLFRISTKMMPSMSKTEREAISAGTVGWESDLFRGNPHWQQLLDKPNTQLTVEEQAFLDGPVEKLCSMINDWDITHVRADLPQDVWRFMKDNGFFGLIIPKEYGGKAFSAYAHSQIITKISGLSITAGTTVSVPNSLGPAELLLHYGTDEQKQYYLPRLARGDDIPCFALTSTMAGSDASSLTDHGVICHGEFEGKRILGIRLNFNKRYITLAPVATVIGLAFKLYDPDHLYSQTTDLGITCALIPRETPGIRVGRRHFPLNSAFQNGPVSGQDVFIPMDWIIGGAKQAGQGWRMLMESLAAGRAISLPSVALGGSKVAVFATGIYARLRKQFNMPIGKFEGVQEPLARIAAYTYLSDAARVFTCMMIDQGEKPAIASAIVKYHATELGRKVACDAMDIHGGKGICLGPHNYLGRGYQAIPIAITVEGANLLTRNMIIFGQGVMRCHPYILTELNAAKMADAREGLQVFDKALLQHFGYAISNTIRTLFLGLTSSVFVKTPKSQLKRYYQQATRFSSALAFMTDVSLVIYGGQLKRRESVSARLGDIHSYLYLLSAVLKRYHEQHHSEDLPIVRYASLFCLFEIQERFSELLKNMPNRWLAWLCHIIIFPWGERFSKPRDNITRKVANLLLDNPGVRDRLAAGAYLPESGDSHLAQLNQALKKVLAVEELEKLIHTAAKEGRLDGYTLEQQAESALACGLITRDQFHQFIEAYHACVNVLSVDDFDPEDLKRTHVNQHYDYANTTKTQS